MSPAAILFEDTENPQRRSCLKKRPRQFRNKKRTFGNSVPGESRRRLARGILASLILTMLLLFAAALPASAQAVDGSIEIRSAIVDLAQGTQTIDASGFQAFYYDPVRNCSTETITIEGAPSSARLIYETRPEKIKYKYTENGGTAEETYTVVGYFGEPYAACAGKANQLARLIIDSDSTFRLKEGEGLSLGSGYILVAKEIDIDGKKFNMELWKDGGEIESKVISLPAESENAVPTLWKLTANVLSERNITVMRVHVSNMFYSNNTNLVEVKGVWLIDYLNAFDIRSDDSVGKFEAADITESCLTYDIKNVRWTGGSDKDLNGKWFLKSDNQTPTKVCLYQKEKLDRYGLGTVTVRGPIDDVSDGPRTYDASCFPGFWYDFEEGLSAENLTLTIQNGQIPKGGLVYTSTPVDKKYNMTDRDVPGLSGTYPVVAIFGDPYVSVPESGSKNTQKGSRDENDAGESPAENGAEESCKATGILAELIADTDEQIRMRQKDTLRIGNGYTLIPTRVDTNGGKVTLELRHNETVIDTGIVQVASGTADDRTWVSRQTVLDQENTEICRVLVEDIFQGDNESIIIIGGLWMIDAENAFEPESGDRYGNMEFSGLDDGEAASGTFRFKNVNQVTLNRNTNADLGGGFRIRTSGDAGAYALSLVRDYNASKPPEIISTGAGTGSGEDSSLSGVPQMAERLKALKDQIEKIEMMERGEWPPKAPLSEPSLMPEETAGGKKTDQTDKKMASERLIQSVFQKTAIRWMETCLPEIGFIGRLALRIL